MFISSEDFEPFAKIDAAKLAAMIDDAEAMAITVAPCLEGSLTAAQGAAVKAILRGAILRWHEAGSGALQSKTAGPFSATFDTRIQRRGMFFPSEITDLQKVCANRGDHAAYTIDMGGGYSVHHSIVCALRFGAAYCSCGSDINGGRGPLFERW